MRLLNWNVQWCRGVDGRVDPQRIADAICKEDADVICLQEVAVDFPELKGNDRADQVQLLARRFSGYSALYAAAVDVPGPAGHRSRFGNVLFSRLPVGRVLRHSLPWPGEAAVPSMPRVAVEAVLETPLGAMRVLTTHLEYYSAKQRAAQVDRLREIHVEACSAQMENAEPGTFRSAPRPASAIVCGDFNMPPEDALCGRMREGFPGGVPRFVDAWKALHSGKPHPPTFHLHERYEGEAPYCCDYVYVTEDLAPRLKSIRVDAATQASDHQPVIVEIG
jgi:endonuclease/exonuclease/phosphatase family metal-dependent hydrolase